MLVYQIAGYEITYEPCNEFETKSYENWDIELESKSEGEKQQMVFGQLKHLLRPRAVFLLVI